MFYKTSTFDSKCLCITNPERFICMQSRSFQSRRGWLRNSRSCRGISGRNYHFLWTDESQGNILNPSSGPSNWSMSCHLFKAFLIRSSLRSSTRVQNAQTKQIPKLKLMKSLNWRHHLELGILKTAMPVWTTFWVYPNLQLLPLDMLMKKCRKVDF